MSDAITDAIRKLTARTIGLRFYLQDQRRGEMDRLSDKLNRVAGIAGRMTSKLEERCDLMIAREDTIEKRSNRIFDAKHAILDDAEAGLDAVERALGQISNDPLPGSGDSSREVSEFVATHPALELKTAPAAVSANPSPPAPAVAVEQSATFQQGPAEQGKL